MKKKFDIFALLFIIIVSIAILFTYNVNSITPLDMFPNTPLVESVTTLTLKKSQKMEKYKSNSKKKKNFLNL